MYSYNAPYTRYVTLEDADGLVDVIHAFLEDESGIGGRVRGGVCVCVCMQSGWGE